MWTIHLHRFLLQESHKSNMSLGDSFFQNSNIANLRLTLPEIRCLKYFCCRHLKRQHLQPLSKNFTPKNEEGYSYRNDSYKIKRCSTLTIVTLQTIDCNVVTQRTVVLTRNAQSPPPHDPFTVSLLTTTVVTVTVIVKCGRTESDFVTNFVTQ